MTPDLIAPRRALLAVADKEGLPELARALHARGVALVSTGGTAQLLREAGLPVSEVSAVTGFPEILDGRVKTLHPRIHAALLARAGGDEQTLAAHGIEPFDLVVVNLYPFERRVARPGLSEAEAIEEIDVGGPAMLRAAAKNFARVAVLCDPAQYSLLLESLRECGGTRLALRRRLAEAAFRRTAAYDAAIAAWFGSPEGEEWPERLNLCLERVASLRYGENPHQRAALYREAGREEGLAGLRQLAGLAPSYNNLLDAEAAWRAAALFEAPACVIVKHASPCGIALGADPASAYERAHAADPVSAYGGVIAFNRPLDGETAERILERQFAEALLAPAFAAEALAVLARKPKLRAFAVPGGAASGREWRSLAGLWLGQSADPGGGPGEEARVVTRRAPEREEWEDLGFAWRCVQPVRSNAIVIARAGQTLGIGGGQPSRVWSVRIAVMKAREAGFDLEGAVMASDAFLPFRDGLEEAARAGVRAVIQPGGSLRDAEVVEAADAHGMTMVLTGRRHFRH
jgi:phosphoribosylaminoimidazolecarboxamide formyltransferase/IMP cyclohydrolase